MTENGFAREIVDAASSSCSRPSTRCSYWPIFAWQTNAWVAHQGQSHQGWHLSRGQWPWWV